MPRSTFGALVNWILSEPTISMRLPHGSRKSRNGPGKRLNPRVGHRFCGALRILAPKLTQKLNLIGVRAGLRCLASCRRLLIQLNRRR